METKEICQQLIRNKCVNDGSLDSGNEIVSADFLKSYLEHSCDQVQVFESLPTRGSVVARISGSNPKAPKLVLCGHTDVVPVHEAMWKNDPFGGEEIDGYIWGRGAVDMLNLTSSMAVAFKKLCNEGFQPQGDVIFLGVADEEAGGKYGASWLLENHTEYVDGDYCLTEAGGFHDEHRDPNKILRFLSSGEKGPNWFKVKVKGQPGHASQNYGVDNALVKAAKLVSHLADYEFPIEISENWENRVRSMKLTQPYEADLLDKTKIDEVLTKLPKTFAPLAHACTHTTVTPTMIEGGIKNNVIPDEVTFNVDMRILPSQIADESLGILEKAIISALGSLENIEIEQIQKNDSSNSSTQTPLFDVICDVTKKISPRSEVVPSMFTGGTDARFYRFNGNIGYGYGLFSEKIGYENYRSMFHGHNERIDLESLELSTQMYYEVVKQFMSV